MTKHWIVAVGILGVMVVAVMVAAVLIKRPDEHAENPHYHAGFQVYINDELQNFADLKYMKMEPCDTAKHGTEHTLEDEQLEKAHLHDLNGDVVHVHRDGATWGDLFINMEFALPEGLIVAYVNGQIVVGDILTQVIKPDDSLVMFIGSNTHIPDKVAQAVTVERIKEVEAQSEDCGKH